MGIPGGKPETGETLQEALHRELMEELHIDTNIGNFIIQTKHLYDFAEVEINLFWATMKNPNTTIVDNEHPNTAWVTLNELDNYKFADADIPLVNHLKQIGIKVSACL